MTQYLNVKVKYKAIHFFSFALQVNIQNVIIFPLRVSNNKLWIQMVI